MKNIIDEEKGIKERETKLVFSELLLLVIVFHIRTFMTESKRVLLSF